MIRTARPPGAYVDPACPLDWSHPLNRGLVSDWTIVPNSGWSRGLTLRNLVRGGHAPNDLTITNASWARGGLYFGTSGNRVALNSSPFNQISYDSPRSMGMIYHCLSTAPAYAATMIITNGTSESTQLGWNAGQFGVKKFGGGTLVLDPSSTQDDDRVHFVMYTWDGTTNRLYVDGVERTNNVASPFSGTPTKIGFSTYDLSGTSPGGEPADDIVIYAGFSYHRCLSPRHIAALYEETKVGNPHRFRWISTRAWSIPTAAAVSFCGADEGLYYNIAETW